MRCEECKWSNVRNDGETEDTYTECRRFPPSEDGFVLVYPYTWCGEFSRNKKIKDSQIDETSEAAQLIQFLNDRSGGNFRAVKANLSMIEARLKEYPLQDLKSMVALKCRAWREDETMSKYMRPATLFNATKCAQYIGELIKEEDDGN